MPDPKKYTVQDTKTGKTVTFEWNDPTPPTDRDFEEVFGSAGLRTASAPAYSTATNVANPNPVRETRPLGDVVRSIARPLTYADPTVLGSTPPKQVAEDVGTALEVGLPFLTTPLPPALRVILGGMLQGTGTAIKSAGMGAPPKRMTQEAVQSMLTGMAGQAVGEGISKGISKTFAPFASQVDQPALATAKKYGVKPMPSEVINETTVGSNTMKVLEDVSSRSIGGAPIVKKARYQNFDALQAYKKDVLDKISPETRPAALKELVVNAVENTDEAFHTVASNLYARVDDAAKNISPSTQNIKAFAQRALSGIPEQERLAAGSGGTQATSLVGMLERVAALPDNIPFKDAQFYRSQLLATARADKSPISGQVAGAARQLSNLFDSEMNRAASAAGSDAYSLYRKASAFWKQGKELFNSDVVRGMAKQEPERLAEYVFGAKSAESIATAQRAISPKTFRGIRQATTSDAWQRFKRAGLENLIESKVFQKVNQQTGDEMLRGANLYETLKGYGDETLNAWLSPQEKRAVLDFAKMASRINTREPSVGAWGMTQAVMSTGAVGFGGPGIGVAGAGVILGTPALYAKLVTSDAGRKWLTEGFRVKPGTQEAIRFASRFLAYMGSDANKGQ